MGKEGTTKRKTESVMQAVRRYGRVKVNDQNITKVVVQEVAKHFKVSQDSVRTACRGLVREEGSGWHGEGDVYEFRLDERRDFRKPNDTHVSEKALEYMRGTEPGSHVPLRTIAAAINARPSSVSASMALLAKDRWLHLEKIRRGVYSYRPPERTYDSLAEVLEKVNAPEQRDVLDELADEAALAMDRQGKWRELANRPDGPEPVSVEPLAPTPAMLEDMQRATREARTQWTHPSHRKPQVFDPEPSRGWLQSQADATSQDAIPAGMYRELTITTNGTVLAENGKGDLFEVIPLRRPA